MNNTQHKNGIARVLQRFRDGNFLQKPVPLLGVLIPRATKRGNLQPYGKTGFEKIHTIEDQT